MENNKTCRILQLFATFFFAKIVSFGYIRECMGSKISEKTIMRDIKFLKDAGILQAKYSKKWKAYIPPDGDVYYGFCIDLDGEFSSPKLPESKSQRMYMEKIIRLCTIMVQVIMSEVENPIEWYREKYPNLSDRTRQRDFRLLQEIGYRVEYLPEDEDGPAGYYYQYPEKYC